MVTWGELAEIIGISRAMLDFVRNGRPAGFKVMRLITAAERAAGLAPPPPAPPSATDQRPRADDDPMPPPVSGKKGRESELRDIRDELARLTERVNRLLGE